MKHAILFMVTGKAFQQCEKPIAIQLRGRLLGKPSKKTFGCWCEAHPSRKPSGKGVGSPQVTALQLTRLVLRAQDRTNFTQNLTTQMVIFLSNPTKMLG